MAKIKVNQHFNVYYGLGNQTNEIIRCYFDPYNQLSKNYDKR